MCAQTSRGEEENILAEEGILRDKKLCQALLRRLEKALSNIEGGQMRFMEVCGTHTVSIFQSGLRSLLPKGITHLSGPGCPVCVTHDAEVAAFLKMAQNPDVCLCTFGDLIRVPGPNGRSLKHAMAEGAKIHIVYSPLDSLAIAEQNPDKTVVFLGIGFETTAPTVAGTMLTARTKNLKNFCVFSLHKLAEGVHRITDRIGQAVRSINHLGGGAEERPLPGECRKIRGIHGKAAGRNATSGVVGVQIDDVFHASRSVVQAPAMRGIGIGSVSIRACRNSSRSFCLSSRHSGWSQRLTSSPGSASRSKSSP